MEFLEKYVLISPISARVSIRRIPHSRSNKRTIQVITGPMKRCMSGREKSCLQLELCVVAVEELIEGPRARCVLAAPSLAPRRRRPREVTGSSSEGIDRELGGVRRSIGSLAWLSLWP